jgi:hypothetical protein
MTSREAIVRGSWWESARNRYPYALTLLRGLELALARSGEL